MSFNYRYLSQRHLRGFDSYKYSSVDTSPLAVYVSHPFWNWLVQFYPRWLAPNTLTFMGMTAVMIGWGICSYYDFDFTSGTKPGAIPRWVWLALSILTFCAHVMDGTDGKQARRLGLSGPTGELFDHGIDSWLTGIFVMTVFTAFSREYVNAFRLMLCMMSACLCFYVSHWEKYNTGILFLSWGYDASQYFLALFYMLTFALGGSHVWNFTANFLGITITPSHVAELGFYSMAFGVSLPMSIYNFIVSYRSGSGHQRSPYEAALPLFALFLQFAASILWALLSPSDVINTDPRTFLLLVVAVFANITCRLIIAQMSNVRVQPMPHIVTAFTATAIVACLLPAPAHSLELPLLRLACVAFVVAQTHYGICVVRQLCAHFHFSCFSTYRAPASPSSNLSPPESSEASSVA